MKPHIAGLLCLYLFPAGAFARDIVIHAGRLIDGVGNEPRTQVTILIEDDRIVGVRTDSWMCPAPRRSIFREPR